MADKKAGRLRELSGLSIEELSQWTFGAFKPVKCVPQAGKSVAETTRYMTGLLGRCREYAANPKGWLILSGDVGSGKTHLAYAIAAEVLRMGVPVFVSAVPELLGLLRSGYKKDSHDAWLKTIQQVGLLVLDDLGAQRDTDWATETLHLIIDWRYRNRRPMVVTTNLDIMDPRCSMEARVRSRLLEGTSVKPGWTKLLRMRAGDYRPRKEEG